MDTNVPVKASYPLSECKEEELEMVGACIEFIHDLINNPKSKLVLDILKYRAKLVRESFQQEIEVHWSKKQINHNKICYGNFSKPNLDASSFHEV